jgi:glycosyltransferase involved in cell wall biosynthesis
LLEDAPLRASMARANRERVRTSYTPEVVMAQLDKVYRGVLGFDVGGHCGEGL